MYSLLTPSPPDPDTFYSTSEVEHLTNSPEVEVYEHNVQVLKRQLDRRQEAAVSRLQAEELARVKALRAKEKGKGKGKGKESPGTSSTSAAALLIGRPSA